MNHDVVLILCSFLLYAGMMWSATRIATAINGFVISVELDKPSEDKSAMEIKHG